MTCTTFLSSVFLLRAFSCLLLLSSHSTCLPSVLVTGCVTSGPVPSPPPPPSHQSQGQARSRPPPLAQPLLSAGSHPCLLTPLGAFPGQQGLPTPSPHFYSQFSWVGGKRDMAQGLGLGWAWAGCISAAHAGEQRAEV